MKTTNSVAFHWEQWTDPGDYPSAAGASPLPPGEPYITDVDGVFVFEADQADEELPPLEELLERAQSELHPLIVTYWGVRYTPQRVELEVLEHNEGRDELPCPEFEDE